MGPHDGKILAVDTVSQNRLNTIKNNKFWRKLQKKILGSLLRGCPYAKVLGVSKFCLTSF